MVCFEFSARMVCLLLVCFDSRELVVCFDSSIACLSSSMRMMLGLSAVSMGVVAGIILAS